MTVASSYPSRPSAVLTGLGSYLPPKVVTNHQLATRMDTSDEWIRSRTGIRQRYVIEPGISTGDLAVEAAKRALKSAGRADVDAVVLATTTPDRLCPATAPEVASRLGMSGVAAVDIGAVCAGFVYALAVGSGVISAGIGEHVLVIGADTFSTIVNPEDRTTMAIFGDGAGAVTLQAGRSDELGALGPFDLGSDGDLAELIMIPAGGSRQRSSGTQAPESDHYFTMRGKSVFQNAVLRMTESTQRVLAAAGWSVQDVDKFVGHQANSRILAALADRLDLPTEKVLSNIDRVGNTSAASIPLALADAVSDTELGVGERVLLTSFGGGLVWGSTTLRWPALTIE
jgi:3-oxoacyl-[acyl-carrier-protein] synthase III